MLNIKNHKFLSFLSASKFTHTKFIKWHMSTSSSSSSSHHSISLLKIFLMSSATCESNKKKLKINFDRFPSAHRWIYELASESNQNSHLIAFSFHLLLAFNKTIKKVPLKIGLGKFKAWAEHQTRGLKKEKILLSCSSHAKVKIARRKS